MRTFASRVVGVAWLTLWPIVASAQTSSIAGVARDASGGVLPGVTVEAASPALIEKVRSVTTDGTGQFKIINLRPGTYTVKLVSQTGWIRTTPDPTAVTAVSGQDVPGVPVHRSAGRRSPETGLRQAADRG